MQESGWSFQYLRSQRAGRFAQLISGYSNPGFVEDLTEMGSIALACNLNLEAFVSMLRTLQPEGHAKVSERFEALRVVT